MPGTTLWAGAQMNRGNRRATVGYPKIGKLLHDIIGFEISQIFLNIQVDDAFRTEMIKSLIAVAESPPKILLHIAGKTQGQTTGLTLDRLGI